MKRQLTFTCGGLLAAFLPSAVLASETADWIRPMSDISAGDTAWVMVSALLVLFMTMPGLALFYAGMVRKKNVLATMVQSIAIACLISLLWICFGYSLAFTSNNGFIGGTERFFLNGLNVFSESEQLTIFPGQQLSLNRCLCCFKWHLRLSPPRLSPGLLRNELNFPECYCLVHFGHC